MCCCFFFLGAPCSFTCISVFLPRVPGFIFKGSSKGIITTGEGIAFADKVVSTKLLPVLFRSKVGNLEVVVEDDVLFFVFFPFVGKLNGSLERMFRTEMVHNQFSRAVWLSCPCIT